MFLQCKEIILLLMFFVCMPMLSMDEKKVCNNLSDCDNSRLCIELLLRNHIEWTYQKLVNASLVNKDWYNIIRIKNIGATQRKEFLKNLFLKQWNDMCHICFDAFTFHPSGVITGFLWKTCPYKFSLCKAMLQNDTQVPTIEIVGRDLYHFGDSGKAEFIAENGAMILVRYRCDDKDNIHNFSKPFFVGEQLGTEFVNIYGDKKVTSVLWIEEERCKVVK